MAARIEVSPTAKISDAAALSRVCTPGVAEDCQAVAEDPAAARRLTACGNSVAVISDGSAVLGLGDIGPRAALPVLEGKAALYQRFAGIDAWPLCLDTREVPDMVRCIRAVAPGFGGVSLEDIAAPRCCDLEQQLREALDVPVFHDDQHGTAVVVLGALLNALRVTGKALGDARIVLSGAGAAGTAIVRLLQAAGAAQIAAFDSHGVLHPDREGLAGEKRWLAGHTQPGSPDTDLGRALDGADVFTGVSAAGVLGEQDVARMADGAVVFALANPDPEIDPDLARRHAAVVATGRSDQPNQINNVLAAVIAGSAALLGFGLDSVVEGLASVIIVWRFTSTRTLSETAEARAQKAVAITFFLLAPYIAYDALATLIARDHPETSWLGIGLSAASLIVMPVLGVAKRRLGARLDSRATAGEGIENLLCAYMAAAVLAGLLANTVLGWWWLDPVVALGIAGLAVRKGIEAWNGDECGC